MINWQKEIVNPYNNRYGTAHKSSGSLIAELRYERKLTWAAIDKALCVSIRTVQKEFEKSPFYDPKKRLRPGTLKDKLLAIPAKELKIMSIREIMSRVPGYERGSYHDILRMEELAYKCRSGNTLRVKLSRIPKKELKNLDIGEIKVVVPGYADCSYRQALKANNQKYKKRKRR